MDKKNIKELVEEAGVKLIPIGENIYRGSCPFHVNVNTPSFTVYTATNSWFCFGESIGGDYISFLSRIEGISYREAKEKIQGNANILQEVTEYLDGMAVKDEEDFSKQLNFSISKYCRDLMYQQPDKVDNILKFLQKLDKEYLTQPVNHVIMEQVIKESREFVKIVKRNCDD